MGLGLYRTLPAGPAVQAGSGKADEAAKTRALHLACAAAFYQFGLPVNELARRHDVDVRTVKRWLSRACQYEGIEANMIRFARSQKARSDAGMPRKRRRPEPIGPARSA